VVQVELPPGTEVLVRLRPREAPAEIEAALVVGKVRVPAFELLANPLPVGLVDAVQEPVPAFVVSPGRGVGSLEVVEQCHGYAEREVRSLSRL
jgi:hypothetical protein